MRPTTKTVISLLCAPFICGCHPKSSPPDHDTQPGPHQDAAAADASGADSRPADLLSVDAKDLQGVDATLTLCDGKWVDLRWDKDNCGACGKRCGADTSIFCYEGVCVCGSSASDKIECNGACVDTLNDPQNCGGCGKACDVASGSTCSQGKCTVCGDGAVDGKEPCDGKDLGGKTCADVGFNGGSLGCKNDCKLDTSGCSCTHPAVVKSCQAGWCEIPAGCFSMGSPASEPCRDPDETQHQVTIGHGFEMMEAEVTQAQFEALLKYKVAGWIASCPACPATPWWYGAAAYCNALSKAKGLTPCYTCPGGEQNAGSNCKTKATLSCPGYRLPTEAEWEYAYRAGTTTAYYSGASGPGQCAGADANADAIGWYDKNAGGKRHPVKGKQPNAWGLHDMAGNVWEWTQDGYQEWGAGAVTDPVGVGSARVIRGGAHYKSAKTLRAAEREWLKAGLSSGWVGFRCVRTLAP